MDISNILNFITIAECGSFSRASEKLYISQPALTKQIKNMEKELGFELFSRNTRRLFLTDSGEIFLRYSRIICESYANMQSEIEQKMLGEYHSLRIGYITNAHKPYIENGLEKLYDRFGAIEVSIIKGMPQDITVMLQKGQLDCAIMHLPSVTGEENILFDVIRSGGCVARISEKNPLSRKKVLSVTDLRDMEILVAENTCPKCNKYTEDCYASRGVTPKWFTVNSIESVEMLTKARDMISFTSEFNSDIAGVRKVPVKEFSAGFDIVLAWSAYNTNPLIKQFDNAIKSDL